ncbi:hypothetical protein RJB87_03090 [Staphylococcus hominis]|uniref:hypothetical protein n=1 Tax=Staphylococcus hominis TaxID=1290 RepID=UPI00287AB075|nr:hypothetical protein [Staphylococcus hominis]MDS3904233.1 hypothetical protein [Staphylococcus hominis]
MIYNKLISGALTFTIILSGCSLNLNLDDKDKKIQTIHIHNNQKRHKIIKMLQVNKMNQQIILIDKILANLPQLKKILNLQ